MPIQAKIILATAVALSVLFPAAVPVRGRAKGDAEAGGAAFEKRCTGCHALDHEKVGPRLAGVIGRKAGSIQTFPYSDAIKKSGLVWNEQLLDQWLSDPDSLIPDNDMAFRLNNADERAAIIAFLKETGK